MPTRELAFERFGLALETTRGTAITAPTHTLPISGALTPGFERYTPTESRGVLNDRMRSKTVSRWSEWTTDDVGLDTYSLPVLANMWLAPVTVPTTPGGGVTSRLWTFTRVMAADTLKSATVWWDEPNIGADRAPFAMVDSGTITCDATGGDAATMNFGGFAQDATQVATPTFPAILQGPLITPLTMQAWLDTSSAIGTTALSNSLLSAKVSLGGGRSRKMYPAGPTAAITYGGVGVKKNHPVIDLRFEYSQSLVTTFRTDTPIKIRVRMNGPLIEGTLYHYVEFDTYATADSVDYGDWADGTNRTIDVTLGGEYDSGIGSDLVLRVQNDRTTL